jgi:hypothetical protein
MSPIDNAIRICYASWHAMWPQVCPRCVLRVLGHSVYDEYKAQPPTLDEVSASLKQHPQQPSNNNKSSEEGSQNDTLQQNHAAVYDMQREPGAQPVGLEKLPEKSGAISAPCICSLCLGVLQLIDGTVLGTPLSAENESGQQGQGRNAMLAGPSHTPDLHQDDTSTAACDGSTGAMAEQAGNLLSGPSPAQMMSLPCMEPLAQARPEDLAAAIASHDLTYSTLGVEMSVPLACIAREHMLHAHLAARWGASLVLGQPADIIPLRPVARYEHVYLEMAVACRVGFALTLLCTDVTNLHNEHAAGGCWALLWLRSLSNSTQNHKQLTSVLC